LGRSKLLAVLVVSIMVVAALGAAIVLLNKEGDSFKIDAQLEVFGNANGDMVIDQNDIDMIKKIIAGNLDFENYPLADANHDGKVDESDIDKVNRIINATSTNKERVFHINQYNNGQIVVDTLYPVTSAAASGASNLMLVFKYLGITDEIKGLSWSTALDSHLFPEYQPLMSKTKLGSAVTNMSTDLVSNLATGPEKITAVITSDNQAYLSTEEPILEGMGIDVVRVMPAAIDEGEYISAVLLIAFLFNDEGSDYMSKCNELKIWYENFMEDLNGKLNTLKDGDRVSAISSSMSAMVSTKNSDYTEVLTTAGAIFPMQDRNDSASSIRYDSASDTWLNQYDIDYLICIRTSTATFSWYGNEAQSNAGKAVLRGYISAFNTLQCYENGNGYAICGDMPTMLRIAYSAEILYPNLFKDNFAEKCHIDFVKKFFGWDEDKVKGKKFSVSMAEVGL